MNANRRNVAAWTAVAILLLVLAMTIWLAVEAGNSAYLTPDPSSEGNERLSLAWGFASWMVKNGVALNSALAVFLTAIALTVSLAGETYEKPLHLGLLMAASLLGLAASLWILVAMDDPGKLNDLRYYGRFSGKTNEQVGGMLQGFFLPLAGWFGTFFAAMLGVSSAADKGALKKLLEKVTGQAPNSGGGTPPPARRRTAEAGRRRR